MRTARIDVVRLLDEATTEPTDVLALVRWQAFNIAAGNNDGHNKNLALIREPRVRLAPAYDLVCTRAWEQLDKSLALRVGGERDAGNVGQNAWERFAEDASLSKKAVIDQVRAVATSVSERADQIAKDVIAAGGDATAVRDALAHVKAQASRSLKLIERSPFKRARPGA